MFRHKPISDTGRCPTCNSPNRNVDGGECLPCLFQSHGYTIPDFAIDALFHRKLGFHARSLVSFVKNLPIDTVDRYYCNSLSLNSSIIKVCEYVQQLVESPEIIARYPRAERWITCEEDISNLKPTRNRKLVNTLKQDLYRNNKGYCAYCGKIFPYLFTELDTVIPLPFLHNGPFDQGNFTRALIASNNVRLVCHWCNSVKGIHETSALMYLQGIAAKRLEAFVVSRDLFTGGKELLRPKRYFLQKHYHEKSINPLTGRSNKRPVSPEMQEELALFMPAFALRCARKCWCDTKRLYFWFAPEQRTLFLSCLPCVRNDILVTVNKPKNRK